MTSLPMRHQALFGDRVVPCYSDRKNDIWSLLEEACAAEVDREAIVCGEERLTWSEVHRRSELVSGWLVSQGVVKQDRVALLLTNDWPFVVALFAIARAGAIAVPVSSKVVKPELQYILEDSSAKILLFDPQLATSVPDPDLIDTLSVCLPFGPLDFWKIGPVAPPLVTQVAEEDTALIVYTSGTTGRLKGAVITHMGVIHSTTNYTTCMNLSSSDRMLCAVPLSNITGIVAMIVTATQAGATVILMREFRAQEFVRIAASEKITYSLLVPAMYNLCLLQADFACWDLSSWRLGAYGAAPMPSATIARMRRALPNLALVNVYGATETTSPCTLLPADQATVRPNSVGRPVPGCEILIMDGAGKQQPDGAIGEIWIRGAMVAKSYWNNPQATDENFIGGFWKSGDLGSFDSEGFLYVHDRQKDMISRGGEKIFSAEVEAALADHPDVVEAAVVGRTCPVLGERPHAFVVLRPGHAAPDESDLREFVSRSLALYKRPESWTLSCEPLPRNPNGKIIKAALRRELEPVPLRSAFEHFGNQSGAKAG